MIKGKTTSFVSRETQIESTSGVNGRVDDSSLGIERVVFMLMHVQCLRAVTVDGGTLQSCACGCHSLGRSAYLVLCVEFASHVRAAHALIQ